MNFEKKYTVVTKSKSLLGDLHTPMGIYLRLRDKYRDTILLESADHNHNDNNFSYIAINAIAGVELKNSEEVIYKFPNENPVTNKIDESFDLVQFLQGFSDSFEVNEVKNPVEKIAQGVFGYTSYDAIPFFESLQLKPQNEEVKIPLLRYRFYQYVIAINHFNDDMYIIENHIDGLKSEIQEIESIINHKDVALFPFEALDEETSNLTDEEYRSLVDTAKKHCFRGDVFQLVLSRRFEQKFKGDEFNVYRSLRNINPSPYLFFFDYGDYKLIGSSPESQLIIRNKKAIIHPIAGTCKRTGNVEKDLQSIEELKKDPKENAEHTMLVDLARNDLSKCGHNTTVTKYKEIQLFSHVIHMVSEVTTELDDSISPYEMIRTTFPQGTLSGAPKYKAMELIDEYEKTSRGYYAGCIGFVGFDGSCNQAIMIRTFLSKNNTLFYQAGAGLVAKSDPESELQEVNNKLGALKKAVIKASSMFNG